MAQYVFRHLHQLPAEADDACRAVRLAAANAGAGLDVQHVTLGPGGKVPIDIRDGATTTILTLTGRGAATIAGDRVELHRNDVVEVQPGCPYGLQAIGGVDWTFLLITAAFPT